MTALNDYNTGDKFVITITNVDEEDEYLKYQIDIKDAWVSQEFLDSCHKLSKDNINTNEVKNNA